MMGLGIQSQDNDIFKQLGIVSQLRGTDGTGIFQIRSQHGAYRGNYDYQSFYKSSDNFSSYCEDIDHIRSSAPKMIMSSCMVDIVMGHVRSATRGLINDDNAHPFRFEKLVGAHNGTLKDQKYIKAGKTDSELMFADMNERGVVEVLEGLDRDSAYALSIYNREDNNMYFVRNELRPLAFAFLKDRDVVYWASESDMLKYVLNRNGVDFNIFNIKPGFLLKVDVSRITKKRMQEAPLDVFENVKKINRLLPTNVQRMLDAKAAREEKEAKEKAEKDAQDEQVSKGTEIVKVPLAKEETPKAKSGDIVPFPQRAGPPKALPKKGKFKVRDLHGKCSCGSKSLNLFECSRAARGQLRGIRYDTETTTYYCEACDPQVKRQEA